MLGYLYRRITNFVKMPQKTPIKAAKGMSPIIKKTVWILTGNYRKRFWNSYKKLVPYTLFEEEKDINIIL